MKEEKSKEKKSRVSLGFINITFFFLNISIFIALCGGYWISSNQVSTVTTSPESPINEINETQPIMWEWMESLPPDYVSKLNFYPVDPQDQQVLDKENRTISFAIITSLTIDYKPSQFGKDELSKTKGKYFKESMELSR